MHSWLFFLELLFWVFAQVAPSLSGIEGFFMACFCPQPFRAKWIDCSIYQTKNWENKDTEAGMYIVGTIYLLFLRSHVDLPIKLFFIVSFLLPPIICFGSRWQKWDEITKLGFHCGPDDPVPLQLSGWFLLNESLDVPDLVTCNKCTVYKCTLQCTLTCKHLELIKVSIEIYVSRNFLCGHIVIECWVSVFRNG